MSEREMSKVLTATNEAIVVLLNKSSGLHRESPADVDQNEDDAASVASDIEALRGIRKTLERRLSK